MCSGIATQVIGFDSYSRDKIYLFLSGHLTSQTDVTEPVVSVLSTPLQLTDRSRR